MWFQESHPLPPRPPKITPTFGAQKTTLCLHTLDLKLEKESKMRASGAFRTLQAPVIGLISWQPLKIKYVLYYYDTFWIGTLNNWCSSRKPLLSLAYFRQNVALSTENRSIEGKPRSEKSPLKSEKGTLPTPPFSRLPLPPSSYCHGLSARTPSWYCSMRIPSLRRACLSHTHTDRRYSVEPG